MQGNSTRRASVADAGAWQVTAQVSTVRDGWNSSRQLPTFTIPRILAPTLEDARARVAEIVNPYGDYNVSFDLYAITSTGEVYRAYKQSATGSKS